MEGINIKSVKKDASKANPRLLEDYTVQFPKGYQQFNGRVTVKFRHITANIISQCYISDGDGNREISDFRVFEKCVKEIHGLTKDVTNADGTVETVEMTVSELVNFDDLVAKTEEEGTNAMSIVFIVVHDVAWAIIEKSSLTQDEEKNSSAGVKPSSPAS